MQIETRITEMKYNKAVRNKDDSEIWEDDDPMFKDYKPNFTHADEIKNDKSIHPEIRKTLYSNLP